MLGLHPVIRGWITLHGSLLIYRPMRDGWLSWPCLLTDSGRLNHKVVTRPDSSLAQDRESSPPETNVLTHIFYAANYFFVNESRTVVG